MDKIFIICILAAVGWWVFKPDQRIAGCFKGAEITKGHIEQITGKPLNENSYKYAYEECKSAKFDNLQAKLKENSNQSQDYINCEIGISFVIERATADNSIDFIVRRRVADLSFSKCRELYSSN